MSLISRSINLSYLCYLLLNKQNTSSNTSNNSGQKKKKSLDTLPLKMVLRLVVAACHEMYTQGCCKVRLFRRSIISIRYYLK